MEIKTAEFIKSSTSLSQCPKPDKPEFAFIGRSNVGKSSLINLLTGRKSLAKTSGKPGKTQTINHFLINNSWYLVDLPGYGYAGVSQASRKAWSKMIDDYILRRENLYCSFVLVDSRHEPQKSDLQFITWLGENSIPLAIILTKADKLSRQGQKSAQQLLEKTLHNKWETLPPIFQTSAEKKTGHEEILDFMSRAMNGEL